jgi:hypothetical protein
MFNERNREKLSRERKKKKANKVNTLKLYLTNAIAQVRREEKEMKNNPNARYAP